MLLLLDISEMYNCDVFLQQKLYKKDMETFWIAHDK
jgi:hypothetical protein